MAAQHRIQPDVSGDGVGDWHRVQNFPEGAAISHPLRQEGFSRFKAFLYGSLSGIVEPILNSTVLAACRSPV
ncbi:MAG: hypothetical protein ACLSA6_16485 [Holdemania massiliensis]